MHQSLNLDQDNMMNYIPRNWGWYVAAVALFGPYFLIKIMEDDVLARVIGLGFLPVGAVPALVWASLSKNFDPLQPTEWLKNKLKNVNVNNLYKYIKFFLLFILILWFYDVTLPYIKDVNLFLKNDIPNIEIQVKEISASTGGMSLKLYFNTEPKRLDAYYFPRNTFEEGYTYKLWYLPNTERVIKAELISTNETQ